MKKLQLRLEGKGILSKDQMKKIIGATYNPNCAGMGSATWYCGVNGTCSYIGPMECQAASDLCTGDGALLTDSSSCTPLQG